MLMGQIGTDTGGSINQQNNVESNNLTEGMTLVHTGNNITRSFEEELNRLNQIISDLQCEEDDIQGQLQWLESRGKKRKRKVKDWLNGIQYLKRRADHAMIHSAVLSEILTSSAEVHRYMQQKPLVLSNEIVGENFELNIKKVSELLKKDQVFIIGIYGMAGVGKTLLASQVEGEIRRKRTFKEVFWVTVSNNFSISKLQRVIAKRIGVKLDDEDDERTRAAILSSALETKEKSILILDDVWKYFDLKKVGIPLRVNGIKVILTTRLEQVCQQMDCAPHSMIEMEPLQCHEDWELFLVKLGHQGTPVTLSSEIENIARSLVKICEGLPLAVNLMARTMKGKLNNVRWWKHALDKLENGEMGEEMELEVLELLKLSYNNLMDKDIQNCFLYCALLPPASSRNEMIMKLAEKGLINGKRSLEKIFVEGSTVLDKLKASYLAHTLFFSSHMLRSLACYIMKKSHRYAMFKYEKGLPCVHEWTFDLEMVSLMFNVGEIPGGMSPCCPRLSTLILYSSKISSIPECFFIHMNALTVLDLSRNQILTSLPKSLSHLRSLVSLVLSECGSLEYVPPLGELQALSRLVISFCSIKEVPQGLEMLISLKWLDLSFNKNLSSVSGSVLSGLTNMQYLDFRNSGIEITAEDIQGMNMLEYFGGTFLNRDTYIQFVQETINNSCGPKHFFITFGKIRDAYGYQLKGKVVYFDNFEEFGYLLLPRAFEELHIWHSNQWTCLCDHLSSEGTSSSWKIDISFCEKLKSLFCSADSCLLCKSSSHPYSTLEAIQVRYCPSMKEIFANAPQSSSRAFSVLKHIYISECHAIEYLLMMPQLQNLETIEVHSCNSMKQVFAYDDDDDDGGSIIELPKLTNLKLSHLPELRLVCKGNIECESSKPSSILQIEGCPKLERDPLIKGCSNYFDYDSESESNC